jgi:adenosylhomocysteine nucleosidase
MTKVAIIAAMPGELKTLVRGWKHERRNGVHIWRWRSNECEWVAACAGAGEDAATRAFAKVEMDGAVDLVISTGWVGALREDYLPGQTYGIAGVIDASTGERFRTAAWEETCWLVTSPKVADQKEKQRLAAAYGAGLVDMEAAGIARLAWMRNIPFNCIKGVSDGFSDQLPDFNRFLSKRGQFRLIPFIAFALLRPWRWSSLMRMGENSKKAADNIAKSLLHFLDERGSIREQNDYPSFKR